MSKLKMVRWCAVALAGLMPVGAALAQSPAKIGILDCVVSDADKSLFTTHLVLRCAFTTSDGGAKRNYQATIDRTGLSLGNIATTKFSWIVATVGSAENVKLDGTYIGAQAGVSAGAGLGGNYLTGGFNKKISLQPYSAEGKQGFGLQLGGQSLQLKEIAQTN